MDYHLVFGNKETKAQNNLHNKLETSISSVFSALLQ